MQSKIVHWQILYTRSILRALLIKQESGEKDEGPEVNGACCPSSCADLCLRKHNPEEMRQSETGLNIKEMHEGMKELVF